MKVLMLMAYVASAMSIGWAGAAERLRPAAPDYVVMHVPARAANDPIAVLEQRYAQVPDQATAAELASLYVERARQQREARYFGRAEMLLQPWISKADVAGATLRVQADILQNRHDFAGALRLLDAAMVRDPRDAGARLMRASVKVVQGHAAEARTDCAAVLAGGESAAGTVCFAQMLGATGHLARAEALLSALLARDIQTTRGTAWPPAVRGWALGLRADFADRRGDARAAEEFLREAMAVTPTNEGVRSALCDLLIARGALHEALAVVALPAPSTGLLARRARAQQLLRDPALGTTRAQLDDLVSLARRRGEIPHLREEALFALAVDGDADRALQLAKQNFATQRETIDARLLVRAARARGDRDALELVMRWMRETGFQDRVITETRA